MKQKMNKEKDCSVYSCGVTGSLLLCVFSISHILCFNPCFSVVLVYLVPIKTWLSLCYNESVSHSSFWWSSVLPTWLCPSSGPFSAFKPLISTDFWGDFMWKKLFLQMIKSQDFVEIVTLLIPEGDSLACSCKLVLVDGPLAGFLGYSFHFLGFFMVHLDEWCFSVWGLSEQVYIHIYICTYVYVLTSCDTWTWFN